MGTPTQARRGSSRAIAGNWPCGNNRSCDIRHWTLDRIQLPLLGNMWGATKDHHSGCPYYI